jgi:hypothetical protein
LGIFHIGFLFLRFSYLLVITFMQCVYLKQTMFLVYVVV